jgi:anti-anti-sigma factor
MSDPRSQAQATSLCPDFGREDLMSSNAPGIVTVDRVGPSTWIVELHGEHDMTNSDRLRAELAMIFAQGTTVVIDLSAATFIDSSTVHELVAAQRRVDEVPNESLAIVAPKDGFAARVLDLLQAHTVLPIFETRADALRSAEST